MENNKGTFRKGKGGRNSRSAVDSRKGKRHGNDRRESAAAYFEIMHPKAGELADEELNNVSGGGCRKATED